jgi:hypothetical protein
MRDAPDVAELPALVPDCDNGSGRNDGDCRDHTAADNGDAENHFRCMDHRLGNGNDEK